MARATGNLNHSHGCPTCQGMRAIAEDRQSAESGRSTLSTVPRQPVLALRLPEYKPHHFDLDKELASVGTVTHVEDMITKRPSVLTPAQPAPKIMLAEQQARVVTTPQQEKPRLSSDDVNKVMHSTCGRDDSFPLDVL